MKTAFAAAAAVLLVAGCGGSRTVTKTVTVTSPPAAAESTTTVTVTALQAVDVNALGPPADSVQFGHIQSLKRRGASFRLRFDPAWLLSGVTASAAAADGTAAEPGEPVADDYYVVDEGHRLLTYVVPADARVTVLAHGVEQDPIAVSELAQIVAGGNPLGAPLFEPIDTGFWIVVQVDTVRSLHQRYVP
jgi:hypothetical protein